MQRATATLSSLSARLRPWLAGLPARNGGKAVLIVLAIVIVAGVSARVYMAFNPFENKPGSDASQYETLSKHLYETGEFGTPEQKNATDWSPGAPYFFAGVYTVTGGAAPLKARLAIALLSALSMLLIYLLGRRLAGPWAGVIGAFLFATYPIDIHNAGRLMSEPLGVIFLLSTLLTFFWAGDRKRAWPDPARMWPWLVPGFLLGLTAFTRPEYLAFTVVLGVLAIIRVKRNTGQFKFGVLAAALLIVAFLVPVAPWTVRNYVELGRVVPISTGGGKALFTGTYLPGKGINWDVRIALIHRFYGKRNARPGDYDPTRLFDKVAEKYPDLERDAALGQVGRENLVKYSTEKPVAFGVMILNKMGFMWGGSTWVGREFPGALIHFLILAAALAGLITMLIRRRWEAVVVATMAIVITCMAGLLLAGTRRNVMLMPLAMAFAGTALALGGAWARDWIAQRRDGRAGRHPQTRPPLEAAGQDSGA